MKTRRRVTESLSLGDVLTERSEILGHRDETVVLTLTEKNGFVRQDERFKKRLATEDTSRYKIVHRGDFAFNPYLLWAGALAMNDRVDEGIVSPLYPIFSVNDGFDPSYLRRLLLSEQMLRQYDGIAFGSVPRRRRSSVRDFLNLRLPSVPCFDEQRRIAAVLDHVDALRAKRRTMTNWLSQLPQIIFRDMFGSPETWHRSWPMGTIGDMVESANYGTSQKAGPSGEWPILRMGNITDGGHLNLSDLKFLNLDDADVPKYTVRRGDLLFNRTNSKEKVGKSAVVHTDRPLAFAGYLVRVRFRSEHRAEFVSAYLGSAHGRAVRLKLAKAAVNQANINAKEMQGIPIALPPTALQARFREQVLKVDTLRAAADRHLAELDTLFASLQSRAFAGELDVSKVTLPS